MVKTFIAPRGWDEDRGRILHGRSGEEKETGKLVKTNPFSVSNSEVE